jgi:hypothetical protein
MPRAANGILLLVLLATRPFGGALASTRLVPGEYLTIQAAIDACEPGDTVLVADGTYSGEGNRDIDFGGRDLVLRSVNGAAATSIDVQAVYPVRNRAVYFHSGESPATVVEGFTIRGGYHVGGGILCEGTASPTIRNCSFKENISWSDGFRSGAAIVCSGTASPLIEDCEFSANDGCDGEGGGIGCFEAVHPIVRRCLFDFNSCSAILGRGGARITIIDCEFSRNQGINGGAILWPNGGLLELSGCLIVGNTAQFTGGGISTGNAASASIVGCTIADNRADGCGGGVYGIDSTLDMIRSILWGNCAGDGNELCVDRTGAALHCCAVDPAGIVEGTGGAIDCTDGCVFEDPLFCEDGVCGGGWSGGDYTLMSSSSCLPGRSPCGEQIGARGQGCSDEVSVHPSSWGKIKQGFR